MAVCPTETDFPKKQPPPPVSPTVAGAVSPAKEASSHASVARKLVTPPMPSNQISQRIFFLLNNMTEHNLDNQVLQIAQLLPHHSIKWLATLLLNRMKMESNLIPLYVDFVTHMCVHHRNFGRTIFDQLTQDIDRLLVQLHSGPSTENGRRLKNLGSFLGRLTIARDIKLCIDLKILIFNAYKNNPALLDYFLPFLCEILKCVALAREISAEVPWVKEIMQVLKELYQITERLPLQFEVELLFSALKVDLASTSSAFYLRHIR